MTDRELSAACVAFVVAGITPPSIIFCSLIAESGFYIDMLGIFAVSVLIGWGVAALHMMLAVPLYRFMRSRGWLNWGAAMAAGAVVGIVPIGLVLIASGSRPDLFEVAVFAAWFGGAGLVGGVAFRLVLGRPEAEA